MGCLAYPLTPALSREGRGSKVCPLPRRSFSQQARLGELATWNTCIRKRMQDGRRTG